MEGTVHGIVLRRRDSGESDRRLTLFTRERGKLDAVAKGARKPASRLAAVSEPLAVAAFTLAEGKVNRFVTQVRPQSAYLRLRTDYDRLTVALATAELFDAVLPYEQSDEDAWLLLERALVGIEAAETPLVASLWAQLRLLAFSGFSPDWRRYAGTDEPVEEADPLFSPRGGGFVREEGQDRYADRYRVRAEVVFAFRALAEREEPPARLRFATDAQFALAPWWRHVAEKELPAFESLLTVLLHPF